MRQKKMLAILGSPHLAGATGTMLDYIIKKAIQNGWEVDRVNLYEKRIAFCSGCRVCLQTKRCVQKDDITEIAELLENCDLVVLASPTYWANVPAIVKNMFDRLLGVAMEETDKFPKPHFSSRQKFLLLTACKTPFPFSVLCGQSSGAIRSMKEFFKTSGMKAAGQVVWTNTKKNNQMPRQLEDKLDKLVRRANRWELC